MNVFEAVEQYTKDGYRVVRCKHRSKAPFGKGWKDGRPPVASEFAASDNIGLLAGEQSDGTFLVDLDLDTDAAQKLASVILYNYSLARHGRTTGGLPTHYWMRGREEVKTRRYLDVDGSCLMEIRGDGVQTIVEPSVHPDGTQVTWISYMPFYAMPSTGYSEVLQDLRMVAALSLLVKHWPTSGSRQHLVMAITGFLLHNEYQSGSVEKYVMSLLVAVGENTPERISALESTQETFRKGGKVTGGPTMASILDQQVYDKFVDFLEIVPQEIVLEDAEEETIPNRLVSVGELRKAKIVTTGEVVEGLLWAGKTHWLYSDPNVGKTMLALAIAMHVAAGKEFAGRMVKQGPVVIIEEDSSLAVIFDYLDNFDDIYDLNSDDLPIHINPVQGIRIMRDRDKDKVLTLIDSSPSVPSLVIFDSCERILPSSAFNSREVDPLDQLLKTLANRGIANLVLDHTTKSLIDHPNDMDVLYGSRAKSAIADIMIQLSGSIKSGAMSAHFTKFRGDTPPGIDIFYRADEGFKLVDRPGKTVSQYEIDLYGWFLGQPRQWMREPVVAETFLDGVHLFHDPKTLQRLRRSLNAMASRRLLRKREEGGFVEYRLNS